MLRQRCLPLLLLIALLGGLAGAPPASAQGSRVPPPAAGMLAAMNQWRLNEGLAPFRPNPTLEALAWLQVNYLLSQPDIPTNLHDGILGEKPRDRARWPQFNWPYYQIPARVSLEEITVAAASIPAGIAWWQNSDTHRRAATNPNYREIGVAALPYKYGTVFVAVLGGRPDVLPALIHPDGQTLYLTRETYSGAQGGDYLVRITGVHLLDGNRRPLTGWQPWSATLPMPEVSGEMLYVEYTDGSKTVTTPVDMTRDIIALPGYPEPGSTEATAAAATAAGTLPTAVTAINGANMQVLVAGPEMFVLHTTTGGPVYLDDFRIFALPPGGRPVNWQFSAAFQGMQYATPNTCFVLLAGAETTFALPALCSGPIVLSRIAPEAAFWYDSLNAQRNSLFVLNRRGRLLANCQDAARPCGFFLEAAPATAGGAGGRPARVTRTIQLVYTPASLTLLNRSGQNLPLRGLELANGAATLNSTVWNLNASTASIDYFPTGDCLEVWGYGTLPRPKPPSCKVRHAWATVQARQQVWTTGTFTVRYRGSEVATCEAAAGECTFELP